MNRKYFLAASLASFLVSPVHADVHGAPPSPSFTSEEQIIIDRNVSLRTISKTNPWVVRRVLDAREKAKPGAKSNQVPPSPGNDPDLGQVERTSPEAAHDLFQLLKQVRNRPK
jgi:hypothetical protein